LSGLELDHSQPERKRKIEHERGSPKRGKSHKEEKGGSRIRLAGEKKVFLVWRAFSERGKTRAARCLHV